MTPLRLVRMSARLGVVLSLLFAGAAAADTPRPQIDPAAPDLYEMRFPVDGPHSFTDSFGAPREGKRVHQGIDIFAEKLTPVVAVADGVVRKTATGSTAGRYIVVEHDDGWLSYYLHLNNDSPGTDDGRRAQPVAGIVPGAVVRAGDLLDYVGDSGNAESTPSHLHFELHRRNGDIVNPYPHLLAAAGASETAVERALQEAGEDILASESTVVVGHFDPGDGFAAGIWVNDDTVYLGTWGRPGACPASGVRLIDVADPAAPQLLTALASGDEFPDTDTDSVWVGAVATESFTGTIAVVAVSRCDNTESGRLDEGFRGLAIYDVSNPWQSRLLGVYDSGSATQGVHDVDVAVRSDGRVLVAATVMQSFLHTDGLLGDVRLVDITNPSDPVGVADWDFRRAAAEESFVMPETTDEEQLHAHSVSFTADGRRLWVANWDVGALLMNVEDPAAPFVADWITEVASAEGNVHSVVSAVKEGVVVLGSEDLHPVAVGAHETGWGYQAIVDLTGKLLSTYSPSSGGPPALDGYHTAHNAVLLDGLLYSSWYSSGVRIVDISDPSDPVEIGAFVPPPAADPQGYWIAPAGSTEFAMVWDVFVDNGLMYVSDMHSGLWIVRYVGDDPGVYAPY